MGILNILAPRQQVLNSQGAPLAGGQVFLYEPGTTTFITSYRDSGLATPHTSNQAVRLSGSGRANIWISRNCDLRIEDRNGRLVLEELDANPDALGTEEAGGLVPNGSFEIDSDANMVPDGYVLVSEAGATNGLDISESTDGAQSFRFTSVGPGGGSLTTTDFFPVNDVDDLRVNVDLRSTVAGVRNIVRVEWFDVSQVAISDSDPYDSTANPLVFTEQQLVVTPPANARFAKIRLIGIDPSVALAGSTYFDRLSVFYPAIVAGIFDNLTLQNNEIISTNLNGDINLRPNGTGAVVIDDSGSPAARSRLAGLRMVGTLNNDPAAGGVQNPVLEFVNSVLTSVGAITYVSTADMRLRNSVHGGVIALEAEDTGGTVRRAFTGNPDGASSISGVGVIGLDVLGDGNVDLRSAANTDAENRRVRFVHQDGTLRGEVGYLTTGELQMIQRVHGLPIRFFAEDTGGTIRELLRLDGDGSNLILNAGTTVAQSITPATGGMNINNQVTGGGLERVATASDVAVRKVKTLGTTRSNTAVLADDPHLSAWALEADTFYMVEAYLHVTAGGNVPDFRYVWQFSQTPQDSLASYISVDDGGVVTQDTAAMNVAPIVQVAALTAYGIHLKGFFHSNLTTGGNLDFQWAQAVSDAFVITLRPGSWMKVEKMT